MADLVIKRGDVPGALRFKDGDIVNAISTHRIEVLHAESICYPRPAGGRFDAQGFAVDPNGLLQLFLEKTRRYRFERRGSQVVRVLLSDLSETDISADMNVAEFLRRRIATNIALGGAGLPIFGSVGAEVWYGGVTRIPPQALTDIWTGIESATGLLRSNHQQAPNLDKRKALVLHVDEFDGPTATVLASEHTDVQSTPVTIDSVQPGATANRWIVGVTGHFGNTVTHFRGDLAGTGQQPSVLVDTVGNEYVGLELRGPNVLVKGRPAPDLTGGEPARCDTFTPQAKRRFWVDYRSFLTAPEIASIDAGEWVDIARSFSRAAIVVDKANP